MENNQMNDLDNDLNNMGTCKKTKKNKYKKHFIICGDCNSIIRLIYGQ